MNSSLARPHKHGCHARCLFRSQDDEGGSSGEDGFEEGALDQGDSPGDHACSTGRPSHATSGQRQRTAGHFAVLQLPGTPSCGDDSNDGGNGSNDDGGGSDAESAAACVMGGRFAALQLPDTLSDDDGSSGSKDSEDAPPSPPQQQRQARPAGRFAVLELPDDLDSDDEGRDQLPDDLDSDDEGRRDDGSDDGSGSGDDGEGGGCSSSASAAGDGQEGRAPEQPGLLSRGDDLASDGGDEGDDLQHDDRLSSSGLQLPGDGSGDGSGSDGDGHEGPCGDCQAGSDSPCVPQLQAIPPQSPDATSPRHHQQQEQSEAKGRQEGWGAGLLALAQLAQAAALGLVAADDPLLQPLMEVRVGGVDTGH